MLLSVNINKKFKDSENSYKVHFLPMVSKLLRKE